MFLGFPLHQFFFSSYDHLSTLGPWKKKCLSEIGVVTQCISPVKITDQYLNNVLLKINSKVTEYFMIDICTNITYNLF